MSKNKLYNDKDSEVPILNNEYEIRGDYTAIKLKTAKGIELETLIDTVDLNKAAAINGSWRPLYSHGTESYYVVYKTTGAKKAKLLSLHRIVMEPIPEKMVIDHINHDTLDNRKSVNLRIVTPSENNKNKRTGDSKGKRKYINWRVKNGKIIS